MPNVDGIEATEQIAHATWAMPVVVLSAYDEPQMIEAALAAGATSCLKKGVGLDELIEAIRSPNAAAEPAAQRRYTTTGRADAWHATARPRRRVPQTPPQGTARLPRPAPRQRQRAAANGGAHRLSLSRSPEERSHHQDTGRVAGCEDPLRDRSEPTAPPARGTAARRPRRPPPGARAPRRRSPPAPARALDHAVRRVGRHDQPIADQVGRLVMAGVHVEPLAEHAVQPRARLDLAPGGG